MGGDEEKAAKWGGKYSNKLIKLFRSGAANPKDTTTATINGVLEEYQTTFVGQDSKKFKGNFTKTAQKYLESKDQNGKRNALAMANNDTSSGDVIQRE
jgi:Tfp pilus assembly protein FimT